MLGVYQPILAGNLIFCYYALQCVRNIGLHALPCTYFVAEKTTLKKNKTYNILLFSAHRPNTTFYSILKAVVINTKNNVWIDFESALETLYFIIGYWADIVNEPLRHIKGIRVDGLIMLRHGNYNLQVGQ